MRKRKEAYGYFQDWIASHAQLETGTTILLCLGDDSILVRDSTRRWKYTGARGVQTSLESSG